MQSREGRDSEEEEEQRSAFLQALGDSETCCRQNRGIAEQRRARGVLVETLGRGLCQKSDTAQKNTQAVLTWTVRK